MQEAPFGNYWGLRYEPGHPLGWPGFGVGCEA